MFGEETVSQAKRKRKVIEKVQEDKTESQFEHVDNIVAQTTFTHVERESWKERTVVESETTSLL